MKSLHGAETNVAGPVEGAASPPENTTEVDDIGSSDERSAFPEVEESKTVSNGGNAEISKANDESKSDTDILPDDDRSFNDESRTKTVSGETMDLISVDHGNHPEQLAVLNDHEQMTTGLEESDTGGAEDINLKCDNKVYSETSISNESTKDDIPIVGSVESTSDSVVQVSSDIVVPAVVDTKPLPPDSVNSKQEDNVDFPQQTFSTSPSEGKVVNGCSEENSSALICDTLEDKLQQDTLICDTLEDKLQQDTLVDDPHVHSDKHPIMSNDKMDDVEPSNLLHSNKAYINKSFVDDEMTPDEKKMDVKSDNSDISNNSTKSVQSRPQRVSFSETPTKKVYDSEGFILDDVDIDGEKANARAEILSRTGKVGEGNGPLKVSLNPDGDDILAKYGPGEKWRILRNVLLVSLGFMFMFTAFFGAANLQSSVNSKAGLGTVSLMGVYAGLIVSNMFVPVVVIRWLGCKWTVALGMLTFAPYAVAQFHAEFYTMVPTALLAGIGGAPMWCAKCTYLNVAADAYSKVTGVAAELVMVRFFGLFYVLFPLGHVWGNLISSEVLSAGDVDQPANLTAEVLELCGANFCPGVEVSVNPNLQRPPDHQINTIAGIFVACMLFASLLVAVGVDNLKRYNEGGRTDSATGLSGTKLLVATLRLLCNRNQLLLIPITAFIGVSQAYLGADFTEGYISCAWGIRHIGYVLLGYGLASSVASVLVSWVVKTAGRLMVICSSITLFLLLVAVMKFWQPDPTQGTVFFALAVLWGMADSTALVINAMYGLLFRGNEAAAYSNFSLWGSAGFIITYSYSPHLCMNVKLAILAVILILSLVGFIIVEFTLRRILLEQKEQNTTDVQSTKEQQVL